MLRQGTVAGFAGHVGVLTGSPLFGFIVVAQDAGVLPGERDRMLPYQVERPRPVVPVLPEGLRDDGAADHQEDGQSGQQDQGRPKQMSGIAEPAPHANTTFPGRVAPPGCKSSEPFRQFQVHTPFVASSLFLLAICWLVPHPVAPNWGFGGKSPTSMG